MFLYICVRVIIMLFIWKGESMYSPEFMRYLINYQKPEYKETAHKKVHFFKFSIKNRVLSYVLLLNKK